MKFFSLLLLFVFATAFSGYCQDTTISQISDLPPEGVVLTNGWKFKAGDNMDWSKPGYDDKQWTPINPALQLHSLPEVKATGIGWFRLSFKVDSLLTIEPLALVISTIGASEIFLNGNLIYRFGVVSADYKIERTRFLFNRPFSIKLDHRSVQVIAVRYSYNKKNLYLKFTNTRPSMKMTLKASNQAFADYIQRESFFSTLRSIQVSFYLPLGFLLLFLYFFHRIKREYLYIGLFCLCFFLGMLMHMLSLIEFNSVSELNGYLLVTQVCYILGAFAFLKGIYTLYKQKRNWFFYFIVIYGLLIIPFFFMFPDWSGIYNACFFPIINFEFLRLNIKAVKRRPGVLILLITSILLAIGLVCFIWLSVLDKKVLTALISSICFVLPGFGLSLFFAGEFAHTRSALHLRVLEVEELSQKALAQEKEKQQILALQNETLDRQVNERTEELSRSLKDLKETQNQLIQREKMASLGELTAGIAHEIENPLNFVNNFSELNAELLAELKNEKSKLNNERSDQLEAELLNSITDNEWKIIHHGKRADAIVKAMLQHSKASSGEKALTDINVLADEYLRLAYYGFRAKDNAYKPAFQMHFDNDLPKINIIPGDIGKALLNIYNNAFYTLNEKSDSMVRRAQNGDSLAQQVYEPTIEVTTKKVNNNVQVSIKDNGNGIPQKILDKIFQPFFTTKPTGQGTGLGLSLSYDIVKAHKGEINVEARDGEGTTFIISLPTHQGNNSSIIS